MGGNKRNSKVLVTGADGFIGSHLTESLVREGYDVRAFVYYNSFNSWGWLDQCASDVKGKFEVFTGDIRDPHGVKEAMKGCDLVLHLAALVAIPYSYHSPDTYIETNIKGTLNVLQASKELGIQRLIHTSTSEVYGDPHVHPQTEEYWGNVNPVGPRGCYDEAKRFMEAITMAYHETHGLETRIIRIFNTYGPKMRLNDGRVLPAFIGQALRGEDLTMFGDGSQTRSFCFVDDLVEGIYRLLMSDYHLPVNVGNPDEISIKDFADEILKLTGSNQKLISLPLPKDDPKQRQPDITKARAILGWEPKVNRAEGLKITYEYFKSLSKEELNKTEHRNLEVLNK